MKNVCGLLVAIMIFSVSAFADIRLPDSPSQTSKTKRPVERMGKMHISLKSDAKVATLKIRRETLRQLRAAIDEAEGADNAATANASFGITRTQTVVSGMFLSLAFVFGGVWMFRAKGKSSKIAMSLIALAVAGAGAGIVFANTAPPSMVSLTSRIFDQNTKRYGYADGNIKIQIIDREPGVYTGLDNTDVILEIPRAAGEADSE